MRRFLTGYALAYNRRHRRHGQLFQNRYKSILCQEELYLLELVRYIHLNPLRARVISDLVGLDEYAYSGHSVLVGRRRNDWQVADYVLSYFSGRKAIARRRYRAYVEEGVERGRRPELVGGGMRRSMAGWEEAEGRREGMERVKGDERILGESGFVEEVLRVSEEQMGKRYRLKAEGYDLERVEQRVGRVLGIGPGRIDVGGKYRDAVEGRSLFCYWAVKELGFSATELARRFGLSQPAVSISVKRGESIAREKGLNLFHE
jgi:hypothetical protein